MEDVEILALYYKRSEDAIWETDRKYGKLCRTISMNVLNDRRDTEEIMDDTWMAMWDTIPPKKPNPLKAYVCRVVKNLSLKRYEHNHAKKRQSNYEESIEELADCICGKETVESRILGKELEKSVNQFLGNLSKEKRILFLRRYWFMDSVKEIARDNHITEKNASLRLARIRQQLREYLIQEGYVL